MDIYFLSPGRFEVLFMPEAVKISEKKHVKTKQITFFHLETQTQLIKAPTARLVIYSEIPSSPLTPAPKKDG